MSRDVSHFDELARLLSLEQRAEAQRWRSEQESLTLQERAERGTVWLDLELTDESLGLGGRVLLTFERADGSPFPAPLHNGNQVGLRPKRADETPPLQALVSRATRKSVQLALDRPPPPWVHEGRVRLELLPNEVTFARAQSALVRLKGWDKGIERRRREVLLGKEPPRFERLAELASSRPLNLEQKDAVQRALAAEDYFLVQGPPGTGKSTVLAEVAVQAVERGERLLVCAASNAAVDHLLELCLQAGLAALRVGHPARVLPRLQQHTLDVVVEEHPDRILARDLFDEAYELFGYARRQRSQGRSRERFSKARASSSEAKSLIEEARALEKKAVRALLGKARIVCSTLAGLESHTISDERFDLALVDEATQATEPLTLLAFLKAKKVILAGDQQQLPPTILSPDAARQGLAVSLFERLIADAGTPDVHRMLKEQYRMNEAIMAFPSERMYRGELRAHVSVASHTLADVLEKQVEAPPVLFLDTAGKGFEEVAEPGTGSLYNEGEAELIVGRAKALLEAGLTPRELGIITPYSAQAARIRDRLSRALPDLQDVEVDTVDAFQGREKDAILVSLVRNNTEGQLGFLTELRRMNVALTRPRRHLFVVGDSATLASHPFYAAFIERTQADGSYRSAWEWND